MKSTEAHRRKMKRVYDRRYRGKLLSRGLTVRGTPRKAHLHHLPRANRNTDRETWLANQRARYRYYRDLNYDQCLTVHGTPRKVFSKLTAKELLAHKVAYNQRYRQGLYAKGLTARGKPRKRPLNNLSALETAYREFRNTLQTPAPRDWSNLVNFGERSETA
jgi:hypothetical protein